VMVICPDATDAPAALLEAAWTGLARSVQDSRNQAGGRIAVDLFRRQVCE
jgi:hypothetical protein